MAQCSSCNGKGFLQWQDGRRTVEKACASCTEPLDRPTPEPAKLEWDGGSLVNPDNGVALSASGEVLATFDVACFYNNGVWREEIRLGLIALLQSMKGT